MCCAVLRCTVLCCAVLWPAGEDAVELARLVERSLRGSHAIDQEALCVLAGRKVRGWHEWKKGSRREGRGAAGRVQGAAG